jgi:hypothetical protein
MSGYSYTFSDEKKQANFLKQLLLGAKSPSEKAFLPAMVMKNNSSYFKNTAFSPSIILKNPVY